jgi:hypothetical protein
VETLDWIKWKLWTGTGGNFGALYVETFSGISIMLFDYSKYLLNAGLGSINMHNKIILFILLTGVLVMSNPGVDAEEATQNNNSVVGMKFPTLTAESLAGNPVTLPDSAKGKVALIVMSFKRDSQSQNDSWMGPFDREFGKKEGFFFYEVPMIRRRFVFMAPLIDSGMRAAIPDEKHKNVVTFYGDVEPYKKELKIEDIYLGYAFLLDKDGIICWQGQGFAKPEDSKKLIETAQRLAADK